MSDRFLVVIPAYNEAKTILEVATRATRHADVCVVDDASTDATAEIISDLERVHCIRHISEEIFVPQRGSEPSRASARLKLLKAAAKSPRSLDAMPK